MTTPRPTPEQDPDAHGLPPGTVLPNASIYRRDQFRARFMVCLVGSILLGLMTLWNDSHRLLYGASTGLVGLAAVILFVRYWIARKQALPYEPPSQQAH